MRQSEPARLLIGSSVQNQGLETPRYCKGWGQVTKWPTCVAAIRGDRV